MEGKLEERKRGEEGKKGRRVEKGEGRNRKKKKEKGKGKKKERQNKK